MIPLTGTGSFVGTSYMRLWRMLRWSGQNLASFFVLDVEHQPASKATYISALMIENRSSSLCGDLPPVGIPSSSES